MESPREAHFRHVGFHVHDISDISDIHYIKVMTDSDTRLLGLELMDRCRPNEQRRKASWR